MTDTAHDDADARPAALARQGEGTDLLLRLAIDKNLDIEKLKELVALKNKEDARRAEREFFDAMAAFQAECPVIGKNRTAYKDNGTTKLYTYADLAEIVRVVRPLLAKYGLSFAWESEIVEGKMAVTCTLRHRNGHSQRASFLAVIAGTALMSDSQKAGSAVTFAQRYSLIQVLGLATADEDDDASTGRPTVFISAEEAANLSAAIDELPNRDTFRKNLLALVGASKISEIPADRAKVVWEQVEKRRKAS